MAMTKSPLRNLPTLRLGGSWARHTAHRHHRAGREAIDLPADFALMKEPRSTEHEFPPPFGPCATSSNAKRRSSTNIPCMQRKIPCGHSFLVFFMKVQRLMHKFQQIVQFCVSWPFPSKAKNGPPGMLLIAWACLTDREETAPSILFPVVPASNSSNFPSLEQRSWKIPKSKDELNALFDVQESGRQSSNFQAESVLLMSYYYYYDCYCYGDYCYCSCYYFRLGYPCCEKLPYFFLFMISAFAGFTWAAKEPADRDCGRFIKACFF